MLGLHRQLQQIRHRPPELARRRQQRAHRVYVIEEGLDDQYCENVQNDEPPGRIATGGFVISQDLNTRGERCYMPSNGIPIPKFK